MKFRGIKLYERFYLTRQNRKMLGDNVRALGIGYVDDDILYYFSPDQLSISLRY